MKTINYNNIGRFLTKEERVTQYKSATLKYSANKWTRIGECGSFHTGIGTFTVIIPWDTIVPHIFTFIASISNNRVTCDILSNAFTPASAVIGKIRIVTDVPNRRSYVDINNKQTLEHIRIMLSNMFGFNLTEPFEVPEVQSGNIYEFDL